VYVGVGERGIGVGIGVRGVGEGGRWNEGKENKG
jgi:hypothetical protein